MATVVGTAPDPVLAAYLPSWRYETAPEASFGMVTDVLYFSIEPDAEGGLDWNDSDPAHLVDLKAKKQKYGFRTYICVGGWERSEHFPAVAADEALRAKFVAELVKFADEYDLDGVDLDWEHPQNEKEGMDYAVLIKELKEALGSKRLVTAAKAGWQEMPEAGWKALDRLHLMAYDHGGEHSTYAKAVGDVESVVSKGMPKSKIALGVPFYGRHVTERDARTAAELFSEVKPGKTDLVDGYAFNNLHTLGRKVEYAKKEGLAGIMVWELAQDREDSLLMRHLRNGLGINRGR